VTDRGSTGKRKSPKEKGKIVRRLYRRADGRKNKKEAHTDYRTGGCDYHRSFGFVNLEAWSEFRARLI